MKTNLAKAKQQVASAIADEKKLQADAENMKKQAEDWERRAMLAVQEGRDDMAKQALGRYNEHMQGAPQLHETWLWHKAETEALKLPCASSTTRSKRPSARRTSWWRGPSGPSAAADPGDDVGDVRQECLRVVRADGRRSRPPSAAPWRRRAERGGLG
jgi:hypothetical protein